MRVLAMHDDYTLWKQWQALTKLGNQMPRMSMAGRRDVKCWLCERDDLCHRCGSRYDAPERFMTLPLASSGPAQKMAPTTGP